MTVRLDNARGLYLHGIRDGRAREALDRYTGDRYTQHSTGVADGKEGFLAFFEPFLLRNPQRDIEVVRAIEDGRYVFLHVAQTLGGTAHWVTADLFDTDENARIIEHWDTIAVGGLTTPSGHTQTGGATEVSDLGRTEENKQKVSDFIATVFRGGQTERVAEFVSQDRYVQHTPGVADGVDGFAAFIAGLAAEGKSQTYTRVHRLVGQGNFVVTLSEVDRAGTPMAVFDIFRLQDGLIVEHWEVAEPVPSPAEANNSGKF
ncbi:nuclear transport factor 2 family protein [Streptomyces sp. MUM 136J]|uniref:nuclear transport factor 2 family protein n=1 Tax=Streptomyces sp. MUM 136J TaxID=2791992 RepID=UPI001F04AB6A|nr:nuclear transport factor 2 family protein [Streptomyces sp. MUM 136J]MCH0568394.1 nuclear transport factor 2 family protein [Streptomyces sp. MUM 136J]